MPAGPASTRQRSISKGRFSPERRAARPARHRSRAVRARCVPRSRVDADGAGDVLGKPFAVGDRDEAILAPVPDRDRDADRVKIEPPRMQERQVVIEPSDAPANGVHQARVRLLRVFPGQRRAVRLRHEIAEDSEVLRGAGADLPRLAFQVGQELIRAALSETHLLDVLLPHPGTPVEALTLLRRCVGDRRRGHHPIGKDRGTGQRVRAAAGPAHDKESLDLERVRDGTDISRAVRHRSPLVAVRPPVTGARVADVAHAPLRSGLQRLAMQAAVVGRSGVGDDHRAFRRSAHPGGGPRAPSRWRAAPPPGGRYPARRSRHMSQIGGPAAGRLAICAGRGEGASRPRRALPHGPRGGRARGARRRGTSRG